MNSQEQVSKSYNVELSPRLRKEFNYFLQPSDQSSPNLAAELTRATKSGNRQILGILTPNNTVAWSNDPRLPVHYYLAQAETTTREAQFQTTKFAQEKLPRIYLDSLTFPAMLTLAKYLLRANPLEVQTIIIDLVSSFVGSQDESERYYKGSVNGLRNKFAQNFL